MNTSDTELLERYRREHSSAAFAAIVKQYVDLVYSVARRHVDSAAAAEDVAQLVFIELARKAGQIRPGTPLVAWLHLVTRRMAINHARAAHRIRAREITAVELEAMSSAFPDWTALAPLLDEAVDSLSPVDRTTVLLRFFENKSLREIGASVGASEDAAQKRVARALNQLRAFFVRRGVPVSSAALATQLSAHAISSAPTALGEAISTAVASAGALAATPFSGTTFFLTATGPKFLPVASLAILLGGALYEARALVTKRSELDASHRSVAALLAQTRDEELTTASLRQQLAAARASVVAVPSAADLQAVKEIRAWLDRIRRLKRLAQTSEKSIPETALLSDKEWLSAAQNVDVDHDTGQLSQEESALFSLRSRAKINFSFYLSTALRAYVTANHDELPSDAQALTPYLKDSPDTQFKASEVTSAMLERYGMRYTGKLADVPKTERNAVLIEVTSSDEDKDQRMVVGPDGLRITRFSEWREDTDFALRSFAKANGDARPASGADLIPYFKPALSPGRQARFLHSADTLLSH